MTTKVEVTDELKVSIEAQVKPAEPGKLVRT